MTKTARHSTLVSLALITSAGLVGCGAGAGASDEDQVIVGGIGPFSGAAAPYRSLIDGSISYFKELERDGVEVDGRTIKFSALDDKTQPDTAVARVRELQSDGAVAIIGPQTSTLVPAAYAVASKFKLPLLAAGTPAELLEGEDSYAYLADISFVEEASMQQQFLVEELDIESGDTVAFVATDTAAGAAGQEAFVTAAEAAGIEVPEVDLIPPGATDVSSIVNKLRQVDADAFAFQLPDAAFTQVMNALKSAGLADIPSINYHAVSVETVAAQKNDNAYFLRQWELTTADNDEMNKVRDAAETDGFEEEFNTSYGFLSSWVTGALVHEAIEQCGADCTGEEIRDALEDTSIKIPGVSFGEVGFAGGTHIAVSSAQVFHYDAAADEVRAASDKTYTAE